MTIRKATVNDAEAIATYLFLAMEDLVYQFIGETDPAKAKAFMFYFTGRENNQYSYQNCWVVENETGVVAAVNIYDGALLHVLRQPVIDYIHTRYHRNFTPEDETMAGEYYIDTFGVHPNLQGRGIGSKILQFLIEEYVYKRRQTLGLLVDEENSNAKRLYLKLGFESIEKKTFLGKHMEHLQRKAAPLNN